MTAGWSNCIPDALGCENKNRICWRLLVWRAGAATKIGLNFHIDP